MVNNIGKEWKDDWPKQENIYKMFKDLNDKELLDYAKDNNIKTKGVKRRRLEIECAKDYIKKVKSGEILF